MKFPLITDLPPSDQTILSGIIAKSLLVRNSYETNFFNARLSYTYAHEILETDVNGLITNAAGNDTPSNLWIGFKKGALYILKSTTSGQTAIFQNIGNETTSNWQSLNTSNKYMYLPIGWDDCWKIAKANSNNVAAVISGIGDSVMIGENASDYQSTSFFSLMRANLLKSYLLNGDYFSLENCSNNGPATPTYPITFQHSPSFSYAALGRTGSYGATPAFPSVTFTTPYACTQIDIVYLDYAAGTWGYNIDGGSTQIVTPTGPGTSAGAIVKKISLTGLSNAVHTIQVGGAGASQNANALIIMGFASYANPGSGIGFANMGVEGQGIVASPQSNNFLTDSAKFPPDKIGLFQGYQGTTANPTSLTGFGFPTAPSLAILNNMINDTTNSATETNFKTGYVRLIQSLRRGTKNCSILFVIPWLADANTPGSSLVAANEFTGTQYQTYRDTIKWIYDLAKVFNCGVINIHAKWGEIPIADGNVHSVTDIHPTDQGYADMGAQLNSIL